MLTGSPAATTGLSFFGYRRILPRWRKENLAVLDLQLSTEDWPTSTGFAPRAIGTDVSGCAWRSET